MTRQLRLLFRILAVWALAVGVGLPVVGWCWFWHDWVPQSTIDRLPNISQAEVRTLLGAPESVDDSPDGTSKWCYRSLRGGGEFQVWFGPDGRVRETHYDR